MLVDGSFQAAAGERAEEDARKAIASAGYAAWAGGLFAQMFFAPSATADRIRARAEQLPEAIGAALFRKMVRWDARNMAAALGRVGVPLLVIQSTMITPERKRTPLAAGANTPLLRAGAQPRAARQNRDHARRRALHDARGTGRGEPAGRGVRRARRARALGPAHLPPA